MVYGKSGNKNGQQLGSRWIAQRSMGLGRALQKAGFGTRKVAESIVMVGRVQVDGRLELDPKVMIGPTSEIFLDNEHLRQVIPVYLVMNKPLRVVCVPSDGIDCELVSEFLPSDVPGLRAVGRMDSRSTGLILASNDSVWGNTLTDSLELEHEYRVQVEGELTDLEVGVMDAGMLLPKMGSFKPKSLRVVELMNGHTVLNVVLTDGKVRQLRRMFTSLRHKIVYLRRVRIADIRLEYLPAGKWRDLTAREIQSIRLVTELTKKQP